MSSHLIIGIDLGTTSISAVLFDLKRSTTVASAQRPHHGDIARLPEGWHEQCPEIIADTACCLVASLLRQSGLQPEWIKALALTGQQHGMIVVDKNLTPLTNLITWRDLRALDVPISLRRHAHGAETGCFLHPGYGGLTLHYLCQKNELPSGAFKALSITGFIAARLTGRLAIDETMAASWGLLDLRSRQWHLPLLDKLDIPKRLLPEIVPSCEPLGHVSTPEMSTLSVQTMVYSPVGDNQAGFAGVGEWDGRHAVINLGTSAQLSILADECDFDPGLETRPFPGKQFLRVHAALCGGWAYAYIANFFCDVIKQIGEVAMPLDEIFQRMQRFSETCETFGLQADTRFSGERNGDVKTGSIAGINTSNLTCCNLVRAVANGIAGELWEGTQNIRFERIVKIWVVGNAACQNPLLLRALEERFGLPCETISTGGEAALGAIRLVCPHISDESL